MACFQRDPGIRREDHRAAWLSEREFIETARMLKTLTHQMGRPEGPVIEAFARHGLDAALGLLSEVTPPVPEDAYERHHARWLRSTISVAH